MSEVLNMAPWWAVLYGITVAAVVVLAILVLVTELDGGTHPGLALFVLAAAPLWPLALLGAVVDGVDLPGSEEWKIARRISRAERDTRLTARRVEAEQAEAKARAAFDRYVQEVEE